MKRIIATSALAVVTLAGAAQAASVSSADLNAISNYVPNGVAVETLSEIQVRTILNAIHSGDSEGEKRQTVGALLK